MTIRTDPENNETRALLDMANFGGQHVLEIGCGDGRVRDLALCGQGCACHSHRP